jgi:hypothetical protein
MEDKVIFVNGFSQDETIKIMRAVKAVMENPGDIAFAMGTETNRTWNVSALLTEVKKEHEYMKKQQG